MDCKKFMGTTNTTYNRLDPLNKGGLLIKDQLVKKF